MTPPPLPQLCTYLMDGLLPNQKANGNIRILYSLKHKHSKKKTFFYEKILVVQWTSINQEPNSMSVMLCTGATFVKKNYFLVARIVSFDTVGLHLITFRILQPYPSKDILTLMTLL